MVAADDELRGDRGSVGAGGEVGDVALDPGQRLDLHLQVAVDALRCAVEGDEPVALDGASPATASAALTTYSSIPRSVRRARSAL